VPVLQVGRQGFDSQQEQTHHCVQTSSQACPASYPMSTRCSFPWVKMARVWSWPLNPI